MQFVIAGWRSAIGPSPALRERVPSVARRVREGDAGQTLTLPAFQAGSLPLPHCGRGANSTVGLWSGRIRQLSSQSLRV